MAIGAAALWFYTSSQGRSIARSTGTQIEGAAKTARDSIEDHLRDWNLRSSDIQEELGKTGKVVRRKARETGQAISDATADARITAAIKGKFLTTRDLSAFSTSVNTTEGVVTLSGMVDSAEDISKAMLVAMQTEGVREVISTLQVRSTNAAPAGEVQRRKADSLPAEKR
jgi:hyperosmotically inducible protein